MLGCRSRSRLGCPGAGSRSRPSVASPVKNSSDHDTGRPCPCQPLVPWQAGKSGDPEQQEAHTLSHRPASFGLRKAADSPGHRNEPEREEHRAKSDHEPAKHIHRRSPPSSLTSIEVDRTGPTRPTRPSRHSQLHIEVPRRAKLSTPLGATTDLGWPPPDEWPRRRQPTAHNGSKNVPIRTITEPITYRRPRANAS